MSRDAPYSPLASALSTNHSPIALASSRVGPFSLALTSSRIEIDIGVNRQYLPSPA